jgi:hypothetical protein
MSHRLTMLFAAGLLLAGCGQQQDAAPPETSASASATLAAPLPAAVGAGSVERLQFASGATSATVAGSVTGEAHIDYVIGLREGQYLNVSLASDNGANYFNLIAPSETDVAYFNGSTGDNQFEGTVPATGDHRIRVYLMRSAARRGETGNFQLEVVAQDSAAPAVAAAKVEAPVSGRDVIRGPRGLEQQCIAKIDEMTSGKATGTNRIEEAEAAIAIYVNVDGADAPWRCLGYRDGTLGEVMYTGDEGAL